MQPSAEFDHKLMEQMGLDNTKGMLEDFFGKHPSIGRNQVLRVQDIFSPEEAEPQQSKKRTINQSNVGQTLASQPKGKKRKLI